jgi:trigger factor
VTSTLERLSPTRVKLTITVAQSELKPALDKAYRQIAAQITIPGFRKGKVPAAVIDQRVGRSAVLAEAVNDVLPNAYGQAVIDSQITPLGQPDIEVVTLEDGQDAVFAATVDVRPDFDLPDIAKIAVEVDAVPADAKQVDEQVELLRERFAEVKDVERAAKDGDQVTIDLAGTQDGVALSDATAEGITYIIGSGGMLDGLDEAVTGLKAGDSKTFTSTLVGGEHEGEQADIKVTVQKVGERSLPEVDDDFAQLVSQFDTVAEMRADLAKSAAEMAKYTQAEQARQKIVDALVAATPFELPEGLLKAEVEGRTDTINQSLTRAGTTLKDYLARSGQAETPEQFWAELEETAEKSLRTQIILGKIAEESDVKVSQSDLTRYIFARAQENGTSPQEELQHMQDHDHLGEWMNEIRRSKALNQLILGAKVTDSDGNPVDLGPVFAEPEPPVPPTAAESAATEVVEIA